MIKGMVQVRRDDRSGATRGKYGSLILILTLIVLLPHFASVVAIAQTTTASIEGIVKDAQGSVVAAAEVAATTLPNEPSENVRSRSHIVSP